jgi:hypothetical protein
MTAYQTAILHISRWAYKRGINRGDAPADPSSRKKSHFRMIALTGRCVVRFHNANIITAYEDGGIELDARGWVDSPTTRKAFAEGLSALKIRNISRPYGMTHCSTKHTVVKAEGKTYVYYDGMRFSDVGELMTVPRPFRETRIDKEETAELARELEASGFKAMYKIIYATCQPQQVSKSGSYFRDYLTCSDRACDWPDIVSYYKYTPTWRRYSGDAAEHGTAASCWSAIMAVMKRSMYNTRDTDITVINPV